MRAAVIFSGCGQKEGTEISEAVFTLLALEKRDIQWESFAPDKRFMARSYLEGDKKELGERGIIDEACRITRCNVHPLEKLKVEAFDLLCLPGGLGASQILSNFRTHGFEGEVLDSLKTIIVAFHKLKKPIVAICISPAVVALALKNQKNLRFTLGMDKKYQEKCPWGHIQESLANDCVVDLSNRIVSTPAFMIEEANRYDVSIGIDKAIEEATKLL
jgi:enhancing lycopene biosynthesis protein 2